MRNELKIIAILLALLILIAVSAVIIVHNAHAEALPPALSGGLRISDAPVDLYAAAILRVDVDPSKWDDQGLWADLTLPYVPPGIVGVALFDGWHLIYGVWQQTGENTLRLRFWPSDLQRLDGTVGVYLVILAERGESNAAD